MKILRNLSDLAQRLDQRTPRERAMVLAVLVLVLLLTWHTGMAKPLQQRIEQNRQQSRDLLANAAHMEQQAQQVRQAHMNDPDHALRIRASELTQQSRLLEERIQHAMEHMVEPRKMPVLLRDLLARQNDITLLRLESIAGAPFHPAAQEVSSRATRTYRHGLRMELKGTYMSLLRYLETVEALPWHFIWHTIEYQVTDHPEAIIYLEIYTIGTQQKWIGV